MDIEIKDLKKVYGTQTVVDIKELTIHTGELIGLVGNNGAGKTTLMRLILDLIKADEGFVMSNGVKGQPTKDRHHWRHAYQSTDTHFRRAFQLS